MSEYPKDTPVILSSDSEGNSYSPMSDVEECLYDPDTTHYIERIYLIPAQLDAYLNAEKTRGYTEEDRAPENAITAVVLWP